MMLQPTEPPGQGGKEFFYEVKCKYLFDEAGLSVGTETGLVLFIAFSPWPVQHLSSS